MKHLIDCVFADSRAALLDMVHDGIRTYEPHVQRPAALTGCRNNLGLHYYKSIVDVQVPCCCKDEWHLICAGLRFTPPAKAKPLPDLEDGQVVRVQPVQHGKLWSKAKVMKR